MSHAPLRINALPLAIEPGVADFYRPKYAREAIQQWRRLKEAFQPDDPMLLVRPQRLRDLSGGEQGKN